MRVSEGLSCTIGYVHDEMLPIDNAMVEERAVTVVSVEEGVFV